MDEVIVDVEKVTPDLLTTILKAAGYLDHGAVASFTRIGEYPARNGEVSIFGLSYTSSATNAAPRRVILKTTRRDAISSRSREVEFYRNVSPSMPASVVPRCYSADYDPNLQKFHILLEDLSETHFNNEEEWPIPPTKRICEQTIDCLATIHASWWDHPRLGKEVGKLPEEDLLGDHIGNLSEMEAMLEEFLNFLGDRLSHKRRDMCKRIVTGWPTIVKRLLSGKNLTVIHGDAHFWNFLLPKNEDTVRLIDWEVWSVTTGARDLAYMIALHWYPERRAKMEQDLLLRYHDQLQKNGVSTYSWDSLWYDYRLFAALNIFRAMTQWYYKGPNHRWWSHLERATLAFEDLDCAEVLAES